MSRLLLTLSTLLLLSCQPATQLAPVSPDVHRLAEQGATVPLIEAITASGDVDRRDICYRTPLMFAAQSGRVDTVRELLAAGARVDLHEKGYYTALMLAAGNGHSGIVRLLAEAGAGVDEVEITHGWTALIWAAKRGHEATVAELLALGARRDMRDGQGRTALDWALLERHPQIVAMLR
ncbi:MAG: ankyrin repeat domain-containing protein [Gammaproteobacteria bacterium]|nr:ankyrin repeat domain-containing protein [Gammaproteobacteria bacterium]